MTKKTNSKDVGWMYYSPTKREEKETVEYPPASQIPGLGNQPPEPETEHKMWIKESDSPYIRLAKMGGQQDLLAFHENKTQGQDEARDYPRCDWFYHEDNVEVDDENKEPYVFSLPEYMVHSDPSLRTNGKEAQGDLFSPERLPYAIDSTSVYQRDGHCTDKTVQIPNSRPSGYGVRLEKQQKTPSKPNKLSSGDCKGGKSRRRSGPDLTGEESQTNMHKLLSNTYEREWHEKRVQWEKKAGSHDPSTGGGGKLNSEYRESFQKGQTDKRDQKSAKKVSTNGEGNEENGGQDCGDDRVSSKRIDREIESMEKDLFKLSRFKNVNSKVETNRNKQSNKQTMYEPSQSDAPKRASITGAT